MKKLRRPLFKALSRLPRFLRNRIVRSFVDISYDEDPDLEFKIATTPEELKESFQLVHDSYVGAGLMKPTGSRMRVTKYHMLPTTTVLICKYKEKVVATMSIIRDSHFKLPADQGWDLSYLREKGLKLAELSSLSIDKEWRRKSKSLLFPLSKYMYEYCSKYTSIDGLIATHNKIAEPFYQGILLFNPLPKQKNKNYDFVHEKSGVPSSGYVDIAQTEELYKKIYGKKKKNKNVFHYFIETERSNFSFPERDYFKTADPILTPELMHNVFHRSTDVLKGLSSLEKFYLQEMYFFDEFKQVIGEVEEPIGFKKRACPRFDFNSRARVMFENQTEQIQMLSCVMGNISYGGVSLTFDKESESFISLGDHFRAVAEIGEKEKVKLKLEVVRRQLTPQGVEVGCRVIGHVSSVWAELISYLQQDLRKTSGSLDTAQVYEFKISS